MRLVICDDNRILCEALAAALEARGHEVVAITTTAAEGVSAAAGHHPDVCLMDLRFPSGRDGVTAARAIVRQSPDTKVLVLSGLVDPAVWSELRKIGVVGFLSKDRGVAQIADTLDAIAAGGLAITDSRGTASRAARERRDRPWYALTPRETEILRRIVAGQGTVRMAADLGIATSTVRTYVKNVLVKLGAHNRLQAAALAVREDLLGDHHADLQQPRHRGHRNNRGDRADLPHPAYTGTRRAGLGRASAGA
jgi:two-component system, NarL family, nitrate/nitrite response regulator NarL